MCKGQDFDIGRQYLTHRFIGLETPSIFTFNPHAVGIQNFRC